MRRSELLLSRKFLIGILLWTATLICNTESLRGSAVVLQAKTKLAEAKAAEANSDDEIINNNGSTATTNNITKSLLTGIPQIDYIHDPNLPRELNGHNLTDYPFYNAVPEEIDFKCDGLHDGFYASVPHKCQVYHHCLFGTRYDFLCANYTAFDQKTFICHFVSEVDCVNSPKYYKRNEALYKEASTTSSTTTTTTTTTTAATVSPQQQPMPSGGGGGMRHGNAGARRRRPYRRRRPMYEYYYDDEEYVDSDYYDEELPSPAGHRRSPTRKQNKDNHGESQDFDTDYDGSHPDLVKPSVRTPSASTSVYDRPRQAPKIRRPVPKNERDKYDYTAGNKPSAIAPISEKPSATQSNFKKHSTQPPAAAAAATDDEYYDEEEEYEYDEPKNVKSKHQSDYDTPTGYEETRRLASRHRSRMPVRKRTGMFDDYDVKERPRINRRKEYNPRYESDRPRNIRPSMHRTKDYRPSGYKKHVDHRRRPENVKRPTYDDYYYYDDEEEEEPPPPPPKRNQRPSSDKVKSAKLKPDTNERFEAVKPQPETSTKYAYQHPSSSSSYQQRTPKTNNDDWEEHEPPKENEIPTTEHSNSAEVAANGGAFRSTQPYKIVKIVNNLFKDVDQNIDPVSTEETRAAVVTQPKPTMISSKAQPFRLEPKRPSSAFDELQNKTTITTTRHFVFTTPVRKPSHFSGGFFATAPANFTYETANKLSERKPQSSSHVSVPSPSSYYKTAASPSSQYIKIPVVSTTTVTNQSVQNGYRGSSNLAGYFVPVLTAEQPRKVKPVEEQVSENLNAIGYGQPYDSSKTQQQPYRQEHRLYSPLQNGGDRLYTNSISFSHQPPPPPPSYDITAPGPSAPADENTSNGDKKYPDLPSYTSNADYDVTFNDALQPSTLHPVRRIPSTMFYVQSQQPRRASPQPQSPPQPPPPPDYGPYADTAFGSLNRSQNRYKRGESIEYKTIK